MRHAVVNNSGDAGGRSEGDKLWRWMSPVRWGRI